MGEFTQQGPAPAPVIDALADVAVEIAVGAFGQAKRPVNVEAEAWGLRCRHRSLDGRRGHGERLKAETSC